MRTRVWLALVLPLLELSYSLSQGVEVKQVHPMNNEPICLDVKLEYRCTVQDSSLRWSYSGQSANEPPIFFTSDFELIGNVFPVGPFDIVLLSISNDGSAVVLSSNATLRAGLSVDEIGTSITCFDADQRSDGFTIEIAELEIDWAYFSDDTISWSPPPCDANCTVSVDGEDINTVPCSDGSLSAMNDLSNNTGTVNITAVDELGRSKVVQASPEAGGTSTAAESNTTNAVTTETSPAADGNNTREIIVIVIVILVVVVVVVLVIVFGAWYCFKGSKRKQCKEFVLYEKSEEVILKGHENSYPDEERTSQKSDKETPPSVQAENGHLSSKKPDQECSRPSTKDQRDKDSDQSGHNQGQRGHHPAEKNLCGAQRSIDPSATRERQGNSDPVFTKQEQESSDTSKLKAGNSDSLTGSKGQRGSHQENQTQKGNASQAKSEEPKDSDSSAKDQGHKGGNPSISGQGQEETKHSATEEEKGGSGSQTDPKTEENTRPSFKIPVKTSKTLIVHKQGQVHRSFEFPITHCTISPFAEPMYIAIAGPTGNIRILNCDTGELVKKYQSSTCIVSLEWLEQYSEDSEENEKRKLMVGSRTKLKIFNPISGTITATVKCKQFHEGSSIICAAHSSEAFIFALSCMLPRKEDDANNCIGLLVIGDVRKQEDYRSLRVASPVSCMVLNHDDKQLITGNMEGKLTIYDVGVENALYTATFCCDWSTPHGIVYDLQYSYDEKEVYSIGENGQFLLQSNIEKDDSSSQPFTNRFELLAGAVSTVKATEEALPARGQLFRFIKGKPCVLTSSYSQGIVYKLKGGQSAAVKLTLPECDANITCVDIRDALNGKFFCVLGCDNNSIHVMKMDVKEK